jgi:hypothetical protein
MILRIKTMNKEMDLQIKVCSFLSEHATEENFIFHSIPNEGLLKAAAGKALSFAMMNNLKKMGLTPGAPDLIIVKGRRAFYIELKKSGGKLSKNQEIFRDNIIKTRTKYSCCDNFDDVIETLKEWCIIPRFKVGEN